MINSIDWRPRRRGDFGSFVAAVRARASARLQSVVGRREAAHAVRSMSGLSDHHLRDLGVTRAALELGIYEFPAAWTSKRHANG